MVTGLVVGIIVVGIVLHALGANGSNAIVSLVYDIDGWLVSPFKGVFSPDGAKLKIAVNWGLAALVYAVVGSLIARLLAGMGGRAVAPGNRRARAV
jgi:hypothetical protein